MHKSQHNSHRTLASKLLRIGLIAIAITLLFGCGASEYNETAYPYQINKDLVEKTKPKKIILATQNFRGIPTRASLEQSARNIDAEVKVYLQNAGYEIVDDYVFDNAWNQAQRSNESIYDPTTGRVNTASWRKVIIETAGQLKKQGVEAVVFTDLVEVMVQHDRSTNHYARWDGVTRKPATQGTGDGVPVDFNWGEQIKAATLVVNIYSTDLKGLFQSQAGIDTLQAVDLKMSNPGWVRRKKILDDDNHIEEAIKLAFHPFIPISNYPDLPQRASQEITQPADK
jgi:hypothetical protein